jgi:hypothetical protein
MISAKQAKELYDQSGAEVEQFLTTQIEPKVTDAARAGKRKYTHNLGALDAFDHLDRKITPLHKAIAAKLVELGYTAKFEKDSKGYVPRGLVDDDGRGPTYYNFSLVIGW